MKKKNQNPQISDMVIDVVFQWVRDKFEPILVNVIRECVEQFICDYMDLPLTVKQVAEKTGKSEYSIYKMCKRNKINYKKIGAQIFISTKELNMIQSTGKTISNEAQRSKRCQLLRELLEPYIKEIEQHLRNELPTLKQRLSNID